MINRNIFLPLHQHFIDLSIDPDLLEGKHIFEAICEITDGVC